MAITFPGFAMPYLRTAKLAARRTQAHLLAMMPGTRARGEVTSPIFIVGCGRSGTTALGKVFITHPEVTYLREPYHLWRSIDPRTDVTGLHGSPAGTRYFLDAADYTQRARQRFDKLIAGAGRRGTRVMEKMPHNVARIGWLESLAPQARYIHIARNGLSVARSIGGIMAKPTWRPAFKSRYAQWWGTNNHRWTALSTEGAARGYFADEVSLLTTDTQKGAYEWMVSLGEADCARDTLGDRLVEITYTELTADTAKTLRRLCDHIDVSTPDDWIARAEALIHRERPNIGDPLLLPPAMAERFNELQARYGFDGRVEKLSTGMAGARS